MKKIIEVQIGFPKCIVQYECEPITSMISTEQLQEELNLQLLQPAVSISLDRAKKYARHQHYVGTQQREFVEFEDWEKD